MSKIKMCELITDMEELNEKDPKETVAYLSNQHRSLISQRMDNDEARNARMYRKQLISNRRPHALNKPGSSSNDSRKRKSANISTSTKHNIPQSQEPGSSSIASIASRNRKSTNISTPTEQSIPQSEGPSRRKRTRRSRAEIEATMRRGINTANMNIGHSAGDKVLVPRLSLTPSDVRVSFKFQRRQFSVMISYAMTINKSQGQSLANVGLYLKKSVFSHGQLYVAVSRVTNPTGLKILLCPNEDDETNSTVNVVYKEVFQNL
ncbi:hypothetical protein CASFOL_020710 [Castilleja foliolosa]|uniref:DNA replication helicase domain-containing protein n=1 Tax=Castilleja foliolosa TaxID=1961234 RepID=A0ABD3D1M5_9LAMI